MVDSVVKETKKFFKILLVIDTGDYLKKKKREREYARNIYHNVSEDK